MTEATFVTSMGSFTARLMPEHAPKTVANFVELAQGSKGWTDPRDGSNATDPLYAGTIFHRVIEIGSSGLGSWSTGMLKNSARCRRHR